MEELLGQWGLESLIPIFTQNEIDFDNLLLLNDDQIRELIPVIGVRIKFMGKLTEYKNEAIKLLDINNLPVVFPNNEVQEIAVQSPSTSSETASDSNTSTNTQLVVVPTYNRALAFCGLENLLYQDDKLPDFDLKTLLTVAPYGSLILKYYKENEILNDFMRNKLVDLIIRNLYSYVMKYNLTHQQYNILSSKIIQCFPNECHSKYYLSKKVMGHAVQAKGKLVDKVKNLRYYSPDKVYLRKRKRSTSFEDDPQTKKTRVETDDEKNAVTWLKFNREPWDQVMAHWKQTFDIRREYECGTVSEFICEWPIIADPRAESLIESDFCMLYPEKELLLLKNWQDFFEKIANLKKKELNEIKDPTLTELLSYLENSENLSADSRTAIQLSVLPRLVPPKGRLKSGKNHWKFSTVESVEAVILHCQSPGDIDVKIQHQINKAAKRKIFLEVQPYLLVQGEITNIKNTYIVIDKIHFKCDSTVKALDLLFKLFYVLKIKYPCQAEQIWVLIQKGIFKIHDKNDKVIPYIEDLLNLFK